jgi:sugar phosphate isomerase/epimerase
MSESDTTQTEQDSTGNASSTPPNRRRVLQGIGAAGAAIAVGAGGSAATESPESRAGGNIANDAHPELDNDEIPTSAQLRSFTGSDKTGAELVQACADAGYHAVEPHGSNDIDAIASAIGDTSLMVGSAHVDGIVGDVQDDPAAVADTYSQFDDPVLVHPGEDGIDWTSRSEVESFADTMSSAASDLAAEGLTLGYHNREAEFRTVGDGTVAYRVFAENVTGDVHLQIDAGWVRAGGADPIQYVIDYADQVGSIHMKNVMDGDPAEIDEGIVGMRGVATAARRAAGVDYLIYEYDDAPNPMESLETGADWLNRLNGPWEPGGVCAVPGFNVHPAKLHRP